MAQTMFTMLKTGINSFKGQTLELNMSETGSPLDNLSDPDQYEKKMPDTDPIKLKFTRFIKWWIRIRIPIVKLQGWIHSTDFYPLGNFFYMLPGT